MNTNLQDKVDGKRMRPGFLVLLAGIVVVLLVAIWFFKNKPPVADETAQSAQSAQPVVPAGTHASALTRPASGTVVPASATAEPLANQWGIEVSRLGLTNQGMAVDVRFKVVAADKAGRLAEGATTMYLLDRASGTKIFMTPPINQELLPPRSRNRMARQAGAFPPSPSRLSEGAVNSVLFPNPGGILKTGSAVALVVGGTESYDVTLE